MMTRCTNENRESCGFVVHLPGLKKATDGLKYWGGFEKHGADILDIFLKKQKTKRSFRNSSRRTVRDV